MNNNEIDFKNYNWDEAIKNYKESSFGLKKWCEMNNVPFSKMKYHLYKVKYISKKADSKPKAKMVKVIPAQSNRTSGSITLELGKAKISIDHQTDMKLVASLLEVINNA